MLVLSSFILQTTKIQTQERQPQGPRGISSWLLLTMAKVIAKQSPRYFEVGLSSPGSRQRHTWTCWYLRKFSRPNRCPDKPGSGPSSPRSRCRWVQFTPATSLTQLMGQCDFGQYMLRPPLFPGYHALHIPPCITRWIKKRMAWKLFRATRLGIGIRETFLIAMIVPGFLQNEGRCFRGERGGQL